MGYLKIKKIVYSGEQYHYESPEFDDKINVIEGPNGCGKSTLVDLICYGLGCYVEHFCRKNLKRHEVICNDHNNYVDVKIEINEKEYVLKRYIDSNDIFVTEDDTIKQLPVNRKDKKQIIFSDWLLKKLNIEPVEIYNNMYSGIINFEELFRLIHYEQKSNQSKIYKEAKSDGNFVSDSLVRRKAIFEILMGKNLINYYSCLNNYKAKEKIYQSNKGVFETFEKSIKELYSENILDSGSNIDEINEKKENIIKLQREMDILSEKEYESEDFIKEISDLKDDITEQEFLLKEKEDKYNRLFLELDKINILIKDREIEIKQLQKIVFTHKELNLFSPTTCPYCFNEVKREKNHCVCGNEVDESYFEKSFYSMEEYLSMIKQKSKSIITLKDARDSILEDIKITTKDINETKKKLLNNKEMIRGIKFDNKLNLNTTGVKRISYKIIELNSEVGELEEREKMYKKVIKLKKDMNEAKVHFERAKTNLELAETSIQTEIDEMIGDFSSIYNELMKKVVKDCKNACINEDYMPVINNGVYINASVDVQIKLVYFITLLYMSISNDVKFPRLLIIDTPESLGIDKHNLLKTLKLLTKLPKERKYQILLTTGIGKYPQSEEFVVKERMIKEKELLKKIN